MERRSSRLWPGVLCLGAALCALVFASGAEARPAQCSTTDDGNYRCDFRLTDKDGSFQVTAPGKPFYILVMESPGVASAFVNLGNRNISLAGRYIRSTTDPACWASEAVKAQICVR